MRPTVLKWGKIDWYFLRLIQHKENRRINKIASHRHDKFQDDHPVLILRIVQREAGTSVGFSAALTGERPRSRTSLSPVTPRSFPSPWPGQQVASQHPLSNPWSECDEAPCQDDGQPTCSSFSVMIDFCSRKLTVPQRSQPLFHSQHSSSHQGQLGPDTENAFILSIWHDDQSLKGHRSSKRLHTAPMPKPRVFLRVIPQWRCCRANSKSLPATRHKEGGEPDCRVQSTSPSESFVLSPSLECPFICLFELSSWRSRCAAVIPTRDLAVSCCRCGYLCTMLR
ncbi:hypothetical protein BJY00DRAFT_107435 [Aspergillus carlsbadensis]|nr:hypothetical protein BJY00DRAFT_107435 [Aspergillus carlsbadensis]